MHERDSDGEYRYGVRAMVMQRLTMCSIAATVNYCMGQRAFARPLAPFSNYTPPGDASRFAVHLGVARVCNSHVVALLVVCQFHEHMQAGPCKKAKPN